jgi:uncharacterized Zn-binding protein involved in type VI secretion
MPSIARAGDTVLSPDGAGKNCAFPLQTTVGFAPGVEVNDKLVRANRELIPVQGNKVTPHNRSGCIIEEPPLTTFSTTVKIGGKGVGRIGDRYENNIITQGSKDVFAGG